ncbi:alpha/beta fold hydrolase [Luteipulveratus mongoliensis]|uniref:AB hydrolase-1 domain-containing protein n=1 Tax=Luteipulveratus mongoliensis TaxID=571913 RepID=A0A0K1JET2_9MICO|nr:alpha/beta fold hydrolase [Luteipulveratus mongoliensis]AKU15113.1 hypothetical protein VV02_03290 [Luteipulveratus mongoliensis]
MFESEVPTGRSRHYSTATDTRQVTVGGRPVRVRVSGPHDGEPILLIHGIARSLEDWKASHDLLARDHRVISMDLPGFGLTRKMRGRPGLEGFAKAVVGVLDSLGEKRPVHLMGNSLGGAVAMAVAAHYPERVASLVLANSAGFGRKVHISPLPIMWAALSNVPGGIGRRTGLKAREAGAQINRDLFYDPSFATPEMIKHAATVGRQPDFQATFMGTALTMGVPGFGTFPGWRRELLTAVRESGIPVLVVWGDTDNVLPVEHLESVATVLPDAHTHLFAQTGHMPQIERADEFVQLASEFVGKSRPSRASR